LTALAHKVQRQFTSHDPQIVPLPAAADAVLYVGALIAVNSSGVAIPAGDTAGTTAMGVCFRGGLDNTGGAAGTLGGTFNYFGAARVIEVDVEGEWEFAVTGTTPKPGQVALVVDDNTVSAAATTNSIPCGRFTRPGSPGMWFVDIERR
jgi:hypothetical protein